MHIDQPFPTPRAIKSEYPLTRDIKDFIESSRQQIRNILLGLDKRLLVIVGPCSIHEHAGALEYVTKLNHLASVTQETLFIVMRTFFEKSRTSTGWKGLMYDPLMDGTHNIVEGVSSARSLLLQIAELGMPTAAEILDPNATPYLSDLISWGCIGARTATSQIHRQMAASLPMPIAFKNSTDGNIQNAINGAIVASQPHYFLGINDDGQIATVYGKGNVCPHIVLRGSDSNSNFGRESLNLAVEKLLETGLPPRFIVDCSHGNSQRMPCKQPMVLDSLLNSIEEGFGSISGCIIESNIKYGQQSVGEALEYGVSVTDPCLDWERTEKMLMDAHERLMAMSVSTSVSIGTPKIVAAQ